VRGSDPSKDWSPNVQAETVVSSGLQPSIVLFGFESVEAHAAKR
jgi:hypothetical protein